MRGVRVSHNGNEARGPLQCAARGVTGPHPDPTPTLSRFEGEGTGLSKRNQGVPSTTKREGWGEGP
jgi:hypothetical protein